MTPEYLYCVVKPSGEICLWTFSTDDDKSWWLFTKQSIDTLRMRKEARAQGYRCVRVQLALAPEAEGGAK